MDKTGIEVMGNVLHHAFESSILIDSPSARGNPACQKTGHSDEISAAKPGNVQNGHEE